MILPLSDVQRAIWDTLSAALTPMNVPVFDDHPTNDLFPYCTLGVLNALPDECLIEQGSQISLQVDVWSVQPGMQETQQIMGEVVEALQHKPLALTDSQWVDTVFELADLVREPDGRTRHGVMRFTVWTFAGAV